MLEEAVKVGVRGGKKDNNSPLMKALTSSADGEVVNACPFGCETADLDEKGHCVHLVGFTLPGDLKTFEVLLPPDENGHRKSDGKRVEKVQKGDKLMRITVSSRVYRPSAAKE